MTNILGKFMFLMLLVLPTVINLVGHESNSLVAFAQEDPIEGEDLDDDIDATVETDDDVIEDDGAVVDAGEEEEEEEEKALKKSPDADTYLLFQSSQGTDFPAGELVKVLVGFRNKGSEDFIVETMDASFRYPQDYSFYIQNFTHIKFDRVVEPKKEATFFYAFTPSESFSARPFGLTINVNYKDLEGQYFQDAVFNDTINIVEADEGLDGETFFLYVFLAAATVLLLLGGQQLLSSFGKKISKSKPKPQIEMGTQNKGDVDYDWLPMEHITKSSPGRKSPKLSPKQRRTRSRGTAED